jgi:hypothetical protein
MARIDRHWTTRRRRPGETEAENIFASPEVFELERPGFLMDFKTYGNYEYGVPEPEPLHPGEWRLRILQPVRALKFKELVADTVLLCAIKPLPLDPAALIRQRDPWAHPADVEARVDAFESDWAAAEAVADVVFENRLGIGLAAICLRYTLADRLQKQPEAIR